MTDKRKQLGAAGEQLVRQYLAQKGWEILAVNLHTRHGELDIVARQGRRLVVVEVKTRRSKLAGQAVEAFTRKKFSKIRHSAWEAQQSRRIPTGQLEFAVAAVAVCDKKAHLTFYFNVGGMRE